MQKQDLIGKKAHTYSKHLGVYRRFLFNSFAFGRVVLWLTLLVDSLEVTDSISDEADNCLNREYAHNAYYTRRSR